MSRYDPVQRIDGSGVIALLLLDRGFGYPILGIVEIHEHCLIIGDLGKFVLSRHLLGHTLGVPEHRFVVVHLHSLGVRFDGIVIPSHGIFGVALDGPHVHYVPVDIIEFVGDDDDVIILAFPRQRCDDLHEELGILLDVKGFLVLVQGLLVPMHLRIEHGEIPHGLGIVRVVGDDLLALGACTVVVRRVLRYQDILLQQVRFLVPVIEGQDALDVSQRFIRTFQRQIYARCVEKTIDIIGHLPDRFLGGGACLGISADGIIVLGIEEIHYRIVGFQHAHLVQQARCLRVHLEFDVGLDAEHVCVVVSVIVVEIDPDVFDDLGPVPGRHCDLYLQFDQPAVADAPVLQFGADSHRLCVIAGIVVRLRQFLLDEVYPALGRLQIVFYGLGVLAILTVEPGHGQFDVRLNTLADHPLEGVHGVGASAVVPLPVDVVEFSEPSVPSARTRIGTLTFHDLSDHTALEPSVVRLQLLQVLIHPQTAIIDLIDVHEVPDRGFVVPVMHIDDSAQIFPLRNIGYDGHPVEDELCRIVGTHLD